MFLDTYVAISIYGCICPSNLSIYPSIHLSLIYLSTFMKARTPAGPLEPWNLKSRPLFVSGRLGRYRALLLTPAEAGARVVAESCHWGLILLMGSSTRALQCSSSLGSIPTILQNHTKPQKELHWQVQAATGAFESTYPNSIARPRGSLTALRGVNLAEARWNTLAEVPVSSAAGLWHRNLNTVI